MLNAIRSIPTSVTKPTNSSTSSPSTVCRDYWYLSSVSSQSSLEQLSLAALFQCAYPKCVNRHQPISIATALRTCSRCQSYWYCSPACAKSDKPRHMDNDDCMRLASISTNRTIVDILDVPNWWFDEVLVSVDDVDTDVNDDAEKKKLTNESIELTIGDMELNHARLQQKSLDIDLAALVGCIHRGGELSVRSDVHLLAALSFHMRRKGTLFWDARFAIKCRLAVQFILYALNSTYKSTASSTPTTPIGPPHNLLFRFTDMHNLPDIPWTVADWAMHATITVRTLAGILKDLLENEVFGRYEYDRYMKSECVTAGLYVSYDDRLKMCDEKQLNLLPLPRNPILEKRRIRSFLKRAIAIIEQPMRPFVKRAIPKPQALSSDVTESKQHQLQQRRVTPAVLQAGLQTLLQTPAEKVLLPNEVNKLDAFAKKIRITNRNRRKKEQQQLKWKSQVERVEQENQRIRESSLSQITGCVHLLQHTPGGTGPVRATFIMKCFTDLINQRKSVIRQCLQEFHCNEADNHDDQHRFMAMYQLCLDYDLLCSYDPLLL